MNKPLVILVMLGLFVLGSSAGFAAHPDWFMAQDDFVLTYDVPNNPGSVGSTFVANGRLITWDTNDIAGWFNITGSTTTGAQSVGDQWVTDYAGSTLTIYADNLGSPGSVVWSGTADWLTTIVNKDMSQFAASSFADRPSYSTDPTFFSSKGSGQFTGSGSGAWSPSQIYVPWLGTYNWNYVYTAGNQVQQIGNMQGKLTTVIPEPMSVLLGTMGMLAVAGFRRLRK